LIHLEVLSQISSSSVDWKCSKKAAKEVDLEFSK